MKFNSDIFTKQTMEMISPVQEKKEETTDVAVTENEEVIMEGAPQFTGGVEYVFPEAEAKEETANTEPESNSIVSIKGLRQIFNEGEPNEYRLFDGFDLEIPNFENEGQFISIMGASGCGKTCLLRAIAGLTTIPEGDIRIYGKSVQDYGHIPMLFQQYSSYEWYTVLDNVALPMILRGVPKEEARAKAMEFIGMVGLTGHENKYAKAPGLSGGQLQRVSIARCLACNSQIMLLDEATSALDVKMKREVQNILLDVYNKSEVDPTIINVTHNIEEAIYLSNRIIILEANPCKVFKTFDVHFTGEETRKRGSWVLETNEFLNFTKELTKSLDEVCSLKK